MHLLEYRIVDRIEIVYLSFSKVSAWLFGGLFYNHPETSTSKSRPKFTSLGDSVNIFETRCITQKNLAYIN